MKTEWIHKKLGDLGYSFSGLSGKTIDDFGEGKPFIPYMNIFTNGKIDPNKLEYVRVADNEHQNKVEKGDWFFTTSSETPEEVGMTSVLVEDIGEAYLNSFCFGFRLYDKSEIDSEFASYLFRSEELRKKISLFAQGSTRYNLPKQQMFDKLYISYPKALSAQRRIAAILASADKVIAATQKTIAKYKQIKQGMMEELFNEQCTIFAQTERSSQIHLDDAEVQPKITQKRSGCVMNNVQWRKVRLGEVGEIVTGSTPATTKAEYWDGEYNFYSPADFGENAYCTKTDRTITAAGMKTGRSVPANSIMVACIASIGKIAINRTEGITNQQINTIIPNDNYNFIFLYYLLSLNVEKIKGKAAQTTIPIINKEDFSNLEFSVPNLSEQRRIAATLSGIDAKIAAEEKVLEKYTLVKKGLMEKLLNNN